MYGKYDSKMRFTSQVSLADKSMTEDWENEDNVAYEKLNFEAKKRQKKVQDIQKIVQEVIKDHIAKVKLQVTGEDYILPS